MKYLYIPMDSKPEQHDGPPSPDDVNECVEGYLQIIRFKGGVFEEMTPIDGSDIDNWTEVANEQHPTMSTVNTRKASNETLLR